MAANLTAFNTLVQNAIAKGTTYNAIFPDYIRMAARFLEQNYPMAYMRQIDSNNFNFASGQQVYTAPGAATMTATNGPIAYPATVKSYKLWRIYVLDNTQPQIPGPIYEFDDLIKCEPQDLLGTSVQQPQAYYTIGRTQLKTDSTPDQAYTGELHFDAFTTWATTSSFAPFLITDADQLLLAQTMMFMATYLEDDEMYARYMKMRDEQIKVVKMSEEDFSLSDQDMVMNYLPPDEGIINVTTVNTLNGGG